LTVRTAKNLEKWGDGVISPSLLRRKFIAAGREDGNTFGNRQLQRSARCDIESGVRSVQPS
jgi:hypothetical protein